MMLLPLVCLVFVVRQSKASRTQGSYEWVREAVIYVLAEFVR